MRISDWSSDVFSSDRQNLYEHIVRNPAGLDKAADEIELGRSGGGKADLNLLDADLHKHVKEALLLFRVHRIDQRLVAVAHIRAEPAWRFGEDRKSTRLNSSH